MRLFPLAVSEKLNAKLGSVENAVAERPIEFLQNVIKNHVSVIRVGWAVRHLLGQFAQPSDKLRSQLQVALINSLDQFIAQL